MKILAAVDLSKASSYIIEAVHRVAMATEAEVTVIVVEPNLPTVPGPDVSPAAVVRPFADAHDLAGLVRQLVEVGVKATPIVRQGSPAHVILNEAEKLGAELIVVGSHGHGLMFEAILGAVSTEVLRHSTVPVLVIPISRSL